MGEPALVIWGLAAGTVVCALQTVRARRLLHAALWLAGTSALTSMLLYSLGARQAAIIELSVGAGLVFILFVFAISLAGEAGPANASALPRSVARCVIGLILLLLVELAWPRLQGAASAGAVPLSTSLWADRQLDVLAQIVLIFAGAVTIVGLLAQGTATATGQPAFATAAHEPLLDQAHPVGRETAHSASGAIANLRPTPAARDQEETLP